jgi:hypothetical protein
MTDARSRSRAYFQAGHIASNDAHPQLSRDAGTETDPCGVHPILGSCDYSHSELHLSMSAKLSANQPAQWQT